MRTLLYHRGLKNQLTFEFTLAGARYGDLEISFKSRNGLSQDRNVNTVKQLTATNGIFYIVEFLYLRLLVSLTFAGGQIRAQ